MQKGLSKKWVREKNNNIMRTWNHNGFNVDVNYFGMLWLCSEEVVEFAIYWSPISVSARWKLELLL